MSRILSVGTAVPPNRVSQEQAKAAFRPTFAPLGDADQLAAIYDHAGVHTRYLAFPIDYYFTTTDFRQRNRDALEVAVEISCAAVARALDKAAVAPDRIGHILFACTTGLATPSVDAYIINRMGLSLQAGRTPLFGLGCSGGVAGLTLAARLVSERSPYVLLVATELCSMTLQLSDVSKRNLIGTALFGDGAGAVIVGPDDVPGGGPVIVDSRPRLFPESYDVMGWDFTETGMQLVMSKEIPQIVTRSMGELVGAFLAAHGLSKTDIAHWLIHPGGRKVLEAYQQALGLTDSQMAPGWTFLRDYGNLSSASVLFILDTLFPRAKPGAHGLMISVGPGFSCDLTLLCWP